MSMYSIIGILVIIVIWQNYMIQTYHKLCIVTHKKLTWALVLSDWQIIRDLREVYK